MSFLPIWEVNRLTHPTFSELSSFVDNELDEEKRKEIENHLNICKECREKVALLKGIDEVIIESTPKWVTENFLDSLELTKKREKRFGFSVKKLALGLLAFLILTLPILGILRTSYEERVNKEFQVLIEEHKSMGIEEVIPIKW